MKPHASGRHKVGIYFSVCTVVLGAVVVVQAQDTLFRGMWWCKLRQAMQSMVSGDYVSTDTAVNIHEFAESLVRGRPNVTFEAPRRIVLIDSLAWNVMLDNVLSNALRHCSPLNKVRPHHTEVMGASFCGSQMIG